jgi:CubicO group peptidase (beta-lactamase class C family)
MGGGLRLLPRDFLKLGQLMLDGGVWGGRQVLSSAFVQRAVTPMVPLRGLRYGYLWWVADYPHGDRKVRAFFAGGNGGQLVMVVPELELVVATLGGNYGDAAVSLRIQQQYVPQFILPAID